MLYSQAVKAWKNQTPVYCLGRKYLIKDNQVKGKYHVFELEPAEMKWKYDNINVSADAIEDKPDD